MRSLWFYLVVSAPLMNIIAFGQNVDAVYSFSADGTECIVHEDALVRPWLNRLGNDEFFTWITHNGYIESFLIDPGINGLVNPQSVSGHFYLRDNSSGEFTLINESEDADNWQAAIGLGYNRVRKKALSLETELTYFIPRNDNLLVVIAEIKNNSSEQKDISVFGQVEWSIGDATKKDVHPSDGLGGSQFNLYKTVSMDDNIMYAETNNWRSTANAIPWPYVGYFTTNEPVASFETSAVKFFGNKQNWYKPEAVIEGKCTNSSFHSYDEYPFGVLQSQISLKPAESKKIVYLLGMERNKEKAKKTINKYSDIAYTEGQLQSTIEYYRNFLENTITINTPDKANDRIINIWSQYHWRQSLKKDLDTGSHGSGFWAYGLEGSNLWLHPEVTLVGLDMEIVKNVLIDILLRNQISDPKNTNIFMGPSAMLDEDIGVQWPPEKIEQGRAVPHHHWIYVFCMNLYYYLIETGDLDFLNEQVPYIDGSTGTVWDHIRTGVQVSSKVINDRGLAIIPKGTGDWMDEFTKISMEGRAESVMLASQVAFILRGFAEIAGQIGEDADRDKWMSTYDKINVGINAHSWDGEWYVRAFSDRTEPPQVVGSNKNEEGKIYLNAQSWPILSGVSTSERANKALDAVEKYLLSDYGALVFWPSYSAYVDYIGTQSIYSPGFRNGNIYFRPAGWAIMAAAMNGRADLANELYTKTSLAERSRDIDRYLLEPYAYPENYIGPDHSRAGEGQFHWCFGEGTAWMWYAYVGYILGVRAELDGLLIDPKIQPDWDRYEVKKPFRNAIYQIEVRNPQHVSEGVKWIKVDGKKIDGNIVVPHKDDKIHKVEVLMGR